MGCIKPLNSTDLDNSGRGDYRKRFEEELDRSIWLQHDLHHMYSEDFRQAFEALGIDIDAPKNLVELPLDKNNSIDTHRSVFHGKMDEFKNSNDRWFNDFFKENGLTKGEYYEIDQEKILSMSENSPDEWKSLQEKAENFGRNQITELGEGVDLGNGIRPIDCLGGAPYYEK